MLIGWTFTLASKNLITKIKYKNSKNWQLEKIIDLTIFWNWISPSRTALKAPFSQMAIFFLAKNNVNISLKVHQINEWIFFLKNFTDWKSADASTFRAFSAISSGPSGHAPASFCRWVLRGSCVIARKWKNNLE